MVLLAPHALSAVLPLLPSPQQAGHLAMAYAAVEGAMPGHVLVDDVVRPRSAIVLNDCGFHAALGVPPDAAADWIECLRTRRLLSAEPGLLIDVTGQWAAALHGVLPPPHLRNEYHAPAVMPGPRPLPDGFQLLPITAAIASRFDGAFDPWVVRIWGGPEALVEKSFGFVVVDAAGGLASFCASLAIGGGEAEIEIGTGDTFRRRGLAQAVAAAFMAASVGRGLVPAWTCRADNDASHRLALALGYRHCRQVLCWPLDPMAA